MLNSFLVFFAGFLNLLPDLFSFGSGPGGAGSSAVSAGPSPSGAASDGGAGSPGPTDALLSGAPAASQSASGGGEQVPAVSPRQITGGSAQVNVSGFFGVDTEVPINTGVSYAVETDTWLFYGDTGTQTANVGIRLGEPDTGVEITRGAYRATARGEACTVQVDVTTTSVSGHISCSGVTALNLTDGTTGIVTIEIDFTADS